MLNSILETRRVEKGITNITLSINEQYYFSFFDSLSEEEASSILRRYLKYRTDDGKPEHIGIRHDKNDHIVTIKANLNYTGNEKTQDPYKTHNYIGGS